MAAAAAEKADITPVRTRSNSHVANVCARWESRSTLDDCLGKDVESGEGRASDNKSICVDGGKWDGVAKFSGNASEEVDGTIDVRSLDHVEEVISPGYHSTDCHLTDGVAAHVLEKVEDEAQAVPPVKDHEAHTPTTQHVADDVVEGDGHGTVGHGGLHTEKDDGTAEVGPGRTLDEDQTNAKWIEKAAEAGKGKAIGGTILSRLRWGWSRARTSSVPTTASEGSDSDEVLNETDELDGEQFERAEKVGTSEESIPSNRMENCMDDGMEEDLEEDDETFSEIDADEITPSDLETIPTTKSIRSIIPQQRHVSTSSSIINHILGHFPSRRRPTNPQKPPKKVRFVSDLYEAATQPHPPPAPASLLPPSDRHTVIHLKSLRDLRLGEGYGLTDVLMQVTVKIGDVVWMQNEMAVAPRVSAEDGTVKLDLYGQLPISPPHSPATITVTLTRLPKSTFLPTTLRSSLKRLFFPRHLLSLPPHPHFIGKCITTPSGTIESFEVQNGQSIVLEGRLDGGDMNSEMSRPRTCSLHVVAKNGKGKVFVSGGGERDGAGVVEYECEEVGVEEVVPSREGVTLTPEAVVLDKSLGNVGFEHVGWMARRFGGKRLGRNDSGLVLAEEGCRE
ncbi:hypothetical protein HDV00_002108 [Rhizophlyctis rosea]|nr:hypothetical protein HDV00_002108 [Rhizophlyctis rosea]